MASDVSRIREELESLRELQASPGWAMFSEFAGGLLDEQDSALVNDGDALAASAVRALRRVVGHGKSPGWLDAQIAARVERLENERDTILEESIKESDFTA
jgi:hypothetical protein